MNDPGNINIVITNGSKRDREIFLSICEISGMERCQLFSVMTRLALEKLTEELAASPSADIATINEIDRCKELLPTFKVTAGGNVTMV